MIPPATDDIGAENRVPFKLIPAEGALQCEWINTRNKRFDEPFFDDTASALRILDPKNRKEHRVTSLGQLTEEAQGLDAITPAVIIFHVSRCGSTLVSQLLATSERFIVLSEVPFFDEILCLPFSIPGVNETAILGYFSSALNFYGRKRYTTEEHVVMKTDCWHIFFYSALRSLFPATPFVMIYRSPDEVLRSNLNRAGRQAIPELVDPRIFGLPGTPDHYQREIYTATIIEKMLAKFLEVAGTDDNCMLANYNEGALAMVKKIAAFANIALSGEEIEMMEQRSHYHSKKPGELFTGEPAAEVPECLFGAMRLYDSLEKKRKMT